MGDISREAYLLQASMLSVLRPSVEPIADALQAAFAAGREAEREAAVCWLWDRAEQYDPSSGIVCAHENRVAEILEGEHRESSAAGELDDLHARYTEAIRARGEQPAVRRKSSRRVS